MDMPPFTPAKQNGYPSLAKHYMGHPAPDAAEYMQMNQPYYYYDANGMFLI